jgi:hypothetical protein
MNYDFIALRQFWSSAIFFTHTFIAPLGCIDIGGTLLNFFENVQNIIYRTKFEFHSICTYFGRANSICMDLKCLLNIFCNL